MGHTVSTTIKITVPFTEQAFADKQKFISLIEDIDAEKAPHGIKNILEVFCAKPQNRKDTVTQEELDMFEKDFGAWAAHMWGANAAYVSVSEKVWGCSSEYKEQFSVHLQTNGQFPIWALVGASCNLSHRAVNIDMSKWFFEVSCSEGMTGRYLQGTIQDGFLAGYYGESTNGGIYPLDMEKNIQPSLMAKPLGFYHHLPHENKTQGEAE